MKKRLFIISASLLVLILAAGAYKLPAEMDRKGCVPAGIQIEKNWEPLKGTEEVKVLMIGDAGMGNDPQRQVAAASAKTCLALGCDMALYLGDNFYQKGVDGIDDPRFAEWFEKVYSQDIPFYAILGNHDVKGNWRAQIEYTNKSGRWIMPDMNYSFSAGPVRFYAVNTNCGPLAFSEVKTDEVSPWKVIVGHHPYLSSGNHGGLNALSALFLEKLDFDFYVAGHEHLLEHLEKENRDVIISGGGGGVLQGKEKDASPHSRFVSRTYGYAWGIFTKDAAEIVFFDGGGNRLYGFTRKK